MNPSIQIKCLNFLTAGVYTGAPRLRDAIKGFMSNVLETKDAEMWSKIYEINGDIDLFTNTFRYSNIESMLANTPLALTRGEIFDRLKGRTVIEIEGEPMASAGDMPLAIWIVAFETDHRIDGDDIDIINTTLKKIINDYIKESLYRICTSVINTAHHSKDLTSFLHRVIHGAIKPEFHCEAVSIFYYEQKTSSLILGATTGIERQEALSLKRSDIRYFVDDKSYTARCWRTGLEIVEHDFRGSLRRNTLGEISGTLHSRVYFPLRRWMGRQSSETFTPVGVIRAVNCNADASYHPVTVLETARLRVFCDAASVLAERYVRALSILHDQERATHGYNTDLAAIRYAAQNVERWLGRFDDPKASKASLDQALLETKYRIRDILAVQDNMASQIITVMHHAGTTRLASRTSETNVCNQPYTDVIMRLVHAKKGMSECYSRNELRLTFNGKTKVDDNFIRIPPLSITIGNLYLVFRNLAENAIKYSKKGLAPKLDISWSQIGQKVEFRFVDNGIGVPERERHLLLREGFRGREAQELQLRGNGLGLAVSKVALEAVGGQLSFQPLDGDQSGSCFIVRLPIQ